MAQAPSARSKPDDGSAQEARSYANSKKQSVIERPGASMLRCLVARPTCSILDPCAGTSKKTESSFAYSLV
jgi:hypothetical protein